MQIHVNTKEAANERPHVHVYKTTRQGKRSLKVWLDTLEVAAGKTYLKAPERRVALRSIAIHKDDLLKMWARIHGKPKKRRSKSA